MLSQEMKRTTRVAGGEVSKQQPSKGFGFWKGLVNMSGGGSSSLGVTGNIGQMTELSSASLNKQLVCVTRRACEWQLVLKNGNASILDSSRSPGKILDNAPLFFDLRVAHESFTESGKQNGMPPLGYVVRHQPNLYVINLKYNNRRMFLIHT